MYAPDNHDSAQPTGLIGSLVALIGALSAYIWKLKAKVSSSTGRKVGFEDLVRNVVSEELRKTPWANSIGGIVREAVADEFRDSPYIRSIDRRLDSLELQREEDVKAINRDLGAIRGEMSALRRQLPAG